MSAPRPTSARPLSVSVPALPDALRLPSVLVAGAIVRLALFAFPALTAALERRPELTSPVTSFRSLHEGVWLYQRGVDPYAGGVLYHSPLYLTLFNYLIPIASAPLTALTWTLADTAAALALVRIWRARARSSETVKRWAGVNGGASREYLVALLYLFNPYILLSCLAWSTTALDNVLVLAAVAGACSGQSATSMLALALATLTSLYPVLLLPPLLLVLRDATSSRGKFATPAVRAVAVFVGATAAIAGLMTALFGTNWARATVGTVLTASDLTPNVGMWWYFFTEMFTHFRSFFRGVFQLHLLVYVAPLCVRLGSDPAHIVVVLVGSIAIWKSYPTLGDMGLWAGLLACFPELIANLRHPLFTLTTHLYTCILLPLLHSLWLLTGSGNANFFYAATMVYGLNNTLAVADVLSAAISVDMKRRLTPLLFVEEGKTSDEAGDDLSIVQLATLD